MINANNIITNQIFFNLTLNLDNAYPVNAATNVCKIAMPEEKTIELIKLFGIFNTLAATEKFCNVGCCGNHSIDGFIISFEDISDFDII